MATGQTGQLFLKPKYDNFPKQLVRDEPKVMIIEHQNSKGSMAANGSPSQPPAIKNAKSSQKKKKSGKKHSGKGDVFRVSGNNINGNTAKKCGVFGFGNKYMGSKKQQEESSEEDESDSRDEDDD